MFLFPATRSYCDSALSAKQYVAKIFSQLWQFAPGGQRLAMNSIQISKTQLASLYGLCVKILFVEIFCVAFWRLGDYEQLNLSIKYFLFRRKEFPCTRKWSGRPVAEPKSFSELCFRNQLWCWGMKLKKCLFRGAIFSILIKLSF